MKNIKKKIKITIIVLFVLGLAGVGTLAGIFYHYSKQVYGEKELKNFNPETALTLYDRNDKLIAIFYKRDGKKTILPANKIPKKIIDSFIAVEDKRFLEHSGLDYKGIFRAILIDILTMSKKEGASTITQQVAKNLLLNNAKSFSRKIKEMILAKRIEEILSKDEIIALYLNNIYFGNNNYGIAEGARFYFNKPLDDLDIGEIAYLAGIPKSPVAYRLNKNPKKAKTRQQTVLRRMLKSKVITQKEFDEFYEKKLEFIGGSRKYFDPSAYFTRHVLKILKSKYDDDFLFHKSLKIKTTLDVNLQKSAIIALQRGLRELNTRQGILTPLRYFEKDKDSLHKLDYISPFLEEGVVIKINNKDGWAKLKTAEKTVIVSKKDLLWVKKFNPSLNYSPKINNLEKILKLDYVYAIKPKIGSMLIVENDKEVDYPIYEIYPIPKVQGAIVSINAKTKEVITLVGGYNYRISQFNRATQSLRQVGSVFKPFVYAATIKYLKDQNGDDDVGYNDFTPSKIVFDTPEPIINRKTGAVWKPMNFVKMEFKNEISLKTALSQSVNMVSVKLFSKVIDNFSKISEEKYDVEKGFDKFLAWLESFGIDSKNIVKTYQMALGNIEIRLIDLVSAYTVFPSYGVYQKPKFILSIKNIDNKELYQDESKENRIMTTGEAYLMVDMMQEVVNHGTAIRVKKLNRPIGGKTGTTNMQRNAWFLGYTKEIVTGVWVGFDNRNPMGRFVQGGRTAAPIWLYYMEKALKDKPILKFEPPEDIVFEFVDKDTGKLTTEDSKNSIKTPFIKGRLPEKSKDDKFIDSNTYILEED
jgi:penicillin-binding protein 1A